MTYTTVHPISAPLSPTGRTGNSLTSVSILRLGEDISPFLLWFPGRGRSLRFDSCERAGPEELERCSGRCLVYECKKLEG